METKDKKGKIINQKEILPYSEQKGQGERNNRHLDEATGKREGSLHYNEFIHRLSGRPLVLEDLPSLTAPSGVDSLEHAAEELVSKRLTENLALDQINKDSGKSTGGGRKGAGRGGSSRPPTPATPVSRDDARYQRFFSGLNTQLEKWRGDSTNYPKIKDRDTVMKTLNDRIHNLRIEDGHRFIYEHFTKENKKGALGLKDKVMTDYKVSLVPGGPDYQRLNLGETWAYYEDDIKKAIDRETGGKVKIASYKDFEDWVTDYGNPDGRFAKETAANPSHFKTLQMWKAIKQSNPC
ncbi:unnamed protein product [Penicillium egyptiacum]|uniref:Uncharacterized protein n=1 Tax=Penicillium egyptiacum TaxID=1303716 RepID=A0A9W4KEY3_9EURO|nr:unnamed protein product [Penicillium egyptiacum]